MLSFDLLNYRREFTSRVYLKLRICFKKNTLGKRHITWPEKCTGRLTFYAYQTTKRVFGTAVDAMFIINASLEKRSQNVWNATYNVVRSSRQDFITQKAFDYNTYLLIDGYAAINKHKYVSPKCTCERALKFRVFFFTESGFGENRRASTVKFASLNYLFVRIMHRRLVEVSLVILCLECCRCDWKVTHSITEQFKCQEPQRRSLRITELLKLNCLDDTVPAHVILNR